MKQQPSGSQWPSTGERAEAPKIAIGPTVTAERSGLSRRALLLMTGVTFAGAALVDMLAAPTTAHADAGDDTRPSVRISSVLFATSFNLDGTLRTELDFPNVLDVDAGFAGPVALTWDPRAFDVAESIIIVFADGRPRAEVTGDQSGPGALTLSLPSGATRILLQARPLLRYPADLVDDLAATQVTVNSEVTQLPLRTQAAAAWGAELYVSWFAYEDRYLPALVEVRSVGPHPTPSGLTVELRVPRPTLGELEPDPSADSSRLDRAGAKPGISIVVDPMPAGASWQTTFELPEDAAEQEPSKPGLTVVPTAALVFTEVVAGDARDTALYSSAPVTASGSSLSDFASEQKA